jgi:hypothetical protein
MLGGFREDIVTGEDVLLMTRAVTRFGEGLIFNPRLIVRHQGRRTWRSFLEHQYTLGWMRGNLKLYVGPGLECLARHRFFYGLVMLRRLVYIAFRTLLNDPFGLVYLLLCFPWVLAGLASWTKGFYLGMKR